MVRAGKILFFIGLGLGLAGFVLAVVAAVAGRVLPDGFGRGAGMIVGGGLLALGFLPFVTGLVLWIVASIRGRRPDAAPAYAPIPFSGDR
ncbi:hypothetical protein [Burkholderia cenocepacia]|uniref:hypothetical protein n=1 Tax=Burkholderia cenocepacia TaxID=95486 RepID=UPI0038CC16E1